MACDDFDKNTMIDVSYLFTFFWDLVRAYNEKTVKVFIDCYAIDISYYESEEEKTKTQDI